LIAAIQKTEHYCIAAWGTARSLAQALDQQDVVRAMEHALSEGKTLDEELTELAEGEITPALLAGESEEEEEEEEEAPSRMSGRGKRGGSERRPST
jgi:ferritin-like metal-binding protein YciE